MNPFDKTGDCACSGSEHFEKEEIPATPALTGSLAPVFSEQARPARGFWGKIFK